MFAKHFARNINLAIWNEEDVDWRGFQVLDKEATYWDSTTATINICLLILCEETPSLLYIWCITKSYDTIMNILLFVIHIPNCI